MKSVKDFNEQEKFYYYQCKSRVLDIILCEAIIGAIAWNFVSHSDVLWQTGLFLLITIPVVFFHVKMLKICPVEGGEIFAAVMLAIFWSIFFWRRPAILTGCLLITIWGLVLFDIFVICYRKRKGK